MTTSRRETSDRPAFFPARLEHGFLTLLIGALIMVLTVWIIWGGRPTQSNPAQQRARMTIPEPQVLPGSPKSEPAAQEPAIGEDAARKLNAAIPFAATVGSPARPFRFIGTIADRARAVDCLALAAMAEAGGGEQGQRAVIQVVLNRVLHPAFAKTICGVVFEGSQRATGCQFTFTCDGALTRRYSPAAWAKARERAIEAIDGLVDAPVGLATHYHTDWVHPYWSDSLVKLARVDTHLFFRWSGYWGNPAALSATYRGGEPAVTQLAYLPSHASETDGPVVPMLASAMSQDSGVEDVAVRNVDGGAFVLLAKGASAESVRATGRAICSDRPSCKVFGWFDRALIPAGYPVPSSARAQLAFSYFRSANNDEMVLYDCERFAGVASEGCIPSGRARLAAQREGAAAAAAETTSQQTASAGEDHNADRWRSAAALTRGGLTVIATR